MITPKNEIAVTRLDRTLTKSPRLPGVIFIEVAHPKENVTTDENPINKLTNNKVLRYTSGEKVASGPIEYSGKIKTRSIAINRPSIVLRFANTMGFTF
jgi:hypothetical protein